MGSGDILVRKLETLLVEALDAVSLPLFIVAPSGEVLSFNKEFSGLIELCHTDQRTPHCLKFWPDYDRFKSDEAPFVTNFYTLGAEETLPIRVKLQIRTLSEGFKVILVLARLSADATVESFHGQRLEALGVLACGIAHDFNNIMAGVLGHITYLKSILPNSGAHNESFLAIEDGIRRAAILTQEILSFSKLDPDEVPSLVNLTHQVRQTVKLLRGAISPEYELKLDLPENLIWALGTGAHVAQIVVNLVINARDALSKGGEIIVRLSSVSDRDSLTKVFRGSDLASAQYCVLTVTDNGCGIPADILPRVVEPFFSTKDRSGTGLGLATVNTIVKELGGALNIDSVVNKGTVVEVYIPEVVGDGACGQEEQVHVEVLPRGKESVLIVDDEYSVLNVLSLSLKHLGYAVSAAPSAKEAMLRYAAANYPFDIVVLDLLMPEISGQEFFAKLRASNGGCKVLLMSGHCSEQVINSMLKSGALDFIAKPFTIQLLANKIRECLDG